MNAMGFTDEVKKYFGSLETEYNFTVTRDANADVRPQTDGVVVYESGTTAIVIDSEIGRAAGWFYRIYRARADKLRHGKDDLVYARIKDASGIYELVKQSLFRGDS